MDVEVAEGGFGSGPGPEGPGPGAGSGLRVLGWVAGAVVLLVVGYLVLSNQSTTATTAASPTATPTPVAPDGDEWRDALGRLPNVDHPWESPAPLSFLSLSTVCPVVTDGRTTMTVSFTMSNPTPSTLMIADIKPALPIGGLRPSMRMTAGGTCAHPGAVKAEGPLLPSQSRLYTMKLRLPQQCPQPFPVGVDYLIWPSDARVPQETILFSDLSSVDFASCPGRTRNP